MTDLSLEDRRLLVGSVGQLSTGWWAMLFIIITEAAIFAFLQFSYYYIAVQQTLGTWPPPNGTPELTLSLPNTIILILSSVVLWWGERAIKRGERTKHLVGLGVAFLLGAIFVAVQLLEWRDKPFTYASSSYGSLFFIITGFHMAHVIAGLIMLFFLFVWSAMGYFDSRRNAPVTIGAFYWHFVDVVWICVFFSLYVTPHLG